MKNFILNMETKIHFGTEMLDTIGESVKAYTNGPILITSGGGSIKRSGIYDKVTSILDASGIEYLELDGIKPNPEVDTARAGIKMIKENNIDFILALGGGSVLDNSKHMAVGAACESDVWDIITNKNEHPIIDSKIPNIGTVITVAATGSEMNSGGVMTNPEFDLKLGYGNPLLAPKFTYEDPTVLETLPEYHKRAGLCDILSHLCENYFGSHTDDGIDDRLVEAIMKNTIAHGDNYISSNNYEDLANIFWSSTLALNGLTRLSRPGSDWFAHTLEHEISAFTDLTHGIGLAIVQPKLLELYYHKDLKEGNSLIKFENLGVNVFEFNRTDADLAAKTVKALNEVFARFGGVVYLEDVEIAQGVLDNDLIANRAADSNGSCYYKLSLDETKQLIANLYK
ncbi:iron-containing alcohol dehydrogenase [Mollicutes bacterium LVI A0039]|nr:iron-containing alcohol dehydrogenase [Mollicutes bacterium LVI A0039]